MKAKLEIGDNDNKDFKLTAELEIPRYVFETYNNPYFDTVEDMKHFDRCNDELINIIERTYPDLPENWYMQGYLKEI